MEEADWIAARALERWTAHEVDCAIAVGFHTFNGYVRLPEGHPNRVVAEVYDLFERERYRMLAENPPDDWPGISPDGVRRLADRAVEQPSSYGYSALDVDVHGGLTYGPDDHGWIGFDTGHAFDWWPVDDLLGHVSDEGLMTARILSNIGLRHQPAGGLPVIRWSRQLLRAEVEHLAEQVAAQAETHSDRPHS